MYAGVPELSIEGAKREVWTAGARRWLAAPGAVCAPQHRCSWSVA